MPHTWPHNIVRGHQSCHTLEPVWEATLAVVDQIDLIVNNGCAAMHAARGRMSTAGAPSLAPLTKVKRNNTIAITVMDRDSNKAQEDKPVTWLRH